MRSDQQVSRVMRLSCGRASCAWNLMTQNRFDRFCTGLQVYHFTHAEPAVVMLYAREILELGQRTGNRQTILVGERVGGSAYLLLGHSPKRG